MKLKWKVSEIPTGPYRSFDTRSWPSAEDEEGNSIAMILSDSEYVPKNVKTGNHLPLSLCFADYSVDKVKEGAFKWKTLKRKFNTLKEVKKYMAEFVILYPQYFPNHEKMKLIQRRNYESV
jgi:hypothetical protein